MLKDLNIFYVKYLKCVSHEFLSLPSRKFNVAKRLIYMWLWDRSFHVCKETVPWIDCQQDSKKQTSISIKMHYYLYSTSLPNILQVPLFICYNILTPKTGTGQIRNTIALFWYSWHHGQTSKKYEIAAKINFRIKKRYWK